MSVAGTTPHATYVVVTIVSNEGIAVVVAGKRLSDRALSAEELGALGPQPGPQTPRNWSNLRIPQANNRPPNPLTGFGFAVLMLGAWFQSMV